RQLLESIVTVEREWPSAAHTLRQELVFGQIIAASQWPADLRSAIPKEWARAAEGQQSPASASVWSRLRHRLFGRDASRARCLQDARLVEVADRPPVEADRTFIAASKSSLFSTLADEDSASSWIRYARRMRSSRTALRMMVIAVEAALGMPARPEPMLD